MADPLIMREAFGKIMVDLGMRYPRLVVLDSDIGGATKASLFGDKFPDRFFQVGVAEQNMVGIAVGLAYVGLVPFAVSFACFLCKRSLDQIRVLVAQPRANVKLVGAYSGLCAGLSGKSHQSVQDIAIMRSMPNMTVIAPLDIVEMKAALKYITKTPGPVYLRLVRGPTSVIFSEDQEFVPGKAILLLRGADITLISTGVQTVYALEAAKILRKEGINPCVLHVSWIKPIDEESIVKAAKNTGIVMTIEEHTITGGLGGAICEVLSERYPTFVRRTGIKDLFGQTGSSSDLLNQFELTPFHIAQTARQLLKKYRKIKIKNVHKK